MDYKLPFKQYNEALKNNKLLALKCKQCSNINIPPKMVCAKCESTDMDIVQLSGKGLIKTFTTINVAAEGRENEVPYTVVMVELAEGPWLMGNLGDVDPAKASMDLIGKAVKMERAKEFCGDKFSAGAVNRPIFDMVK